MNKGFKVAVKNTNLRVAQHFYDRHKFANVDFLRDTLVMYGVWCLKF